MPRCIQHCRKIEGIGGRKDKMYGKAINNNLSKEEIDKLEQQTRIKLILAEVKQNL